MVLWVSLVMSLANDSISADGLIDLSPHLRHFPIILRILML